MPAETSLFRVGAPEDQGEPGDDVRRRLVHMMRTRQEEMVVAEVVAAVIWEKRDQPWEFTLDLARHEWDEMRHALMGQAALEAEGIDWMRYPQFTGDYDLNATNVPRRSTPGCSASSRTPCGAPANEASSSSAATRPTTR